MKTQQAQWDSLPVAAAEMVAEITKAAAEMVAEITKLREEVARLKEALAASEEKNI
jgi:hypothetical protein